MSQFYINSKKRNIHWKKLDVSQVLNTSKVKDEIVYNNSKNKNLIEDTSLNELKLKLHDEFSHILNFQKNNQENSISKDVTNDNPEIAKAKTNILEIEKLMGLENKTPSSVDKIKDNSQDLLLVLNELRILSEKRLYLSKNLNIIDNSLSKLQSKLLAKKKEYDKQVSDLKSMSSLYEQSSTLISKIISEDTKYD